MPADILEHCNTVEECYEFRLAYAAQGHPSDQGSKSGTQIREFLQRAATAIAALPEAYAKVVNDKHLEPAEKYHAFLSVLDRDARDSLAAIDLVLAQPSISSQLVDNLNASVHLRALLTDLFLVSDVLSSHLVSRQIS
jgi:ATPase subunit of ABC transporter with duplicated ATPase domains